MTELQESICRFFADHYGRAAQSDKAREELREVGEELDKPTGGLPEEIADAYVMLYQLRYLYRIPDSELDVWIDTKLTRQLERIAEEER